MQLPRAVLWPILWLVHFSTIATPYPASLQPQNVLLSPQSYDEQNVFTKPTRYESTVLARRLLARSSAGILSTVFPSSFSNYSDSSPAEAKPLLSKVPESVASKAIGLSEYFADCEGNGNPTFIALDVELSSRNVAAGSNVSLAISWWDQYAKLTHREPWSAANLPRASLIGWLEELSEKEVEQGDIEKCFTGAHRDSRLWLPGDPGAAHNGRWMRMMVEEIYWIGGFGDKNFIGWFDVSEWRSVRREEWESVKLPGE